jgi:hypothetical protein
MKYLILGALLLVLRSSAHSWTDWQELQLICEVRITKPVTYGANEFVRGPKDGWYEICRWGYVTHYVTKK